ncbi:MAG: pyridoxal phosphate-dependent aminotransferase [Synergistaceae bacterium]|nr:pyridoxal phosphate-dependent aminotransferase [Synergistaceae bacterium]
MKLSRRAERTSPSATLAISALARELKASGRPVLSFSAGEPDFRSPESALTAAKDAIERGETHYTANSGIPELKSAVISYYRDRFGLEYSPQEVIVSGGAKQVLYEIIQTLTDESDEVLLPSPAWVSYVEQIRMAGGCAVPADTTDTGFIPSEDRLKRALSDRTKGIILNTPNNPVGTVYDEDTLRMIAGLARANDLWIIYDEIYERLVYGEAKHRNILQLAPDLRDRVIIVNGVSKTYSMTGWRIGYALGPKEVIAKADDLQSHMASNPSSIAQWAAVGAINGPDDYIERCRSEFERRRDILTGILGGVKGLSMTRPDGAFYAFLDIRNTGIPDDMEFCRRILEEKYTALVPGSAFLAPGFVRMSYACSEDDIREGASRIKDFIESLRNEHPQY